MKIIGNTLKLELSKDETVALFNEILDLKQLSSYSEAKEEFEALEFYTLSSFITILENNS